MPWPPYAQWSRDDLHAVSLYLRSLTPLSDEGPASRLVGAAASASGRPCGPAIYDAYCVTCHGEKGMGSPFTTVPLRDVVGDLDDDALGAFVTEGLSDSTMPGFGRTLKEDQIADVTAFIRSW